MLRYLVGENNKMINNVSLRTSKTTLELQKPQHKAHLSLNQPSKDSVQFTSGKLKTLSQKEIDNRIKHFEKLLEGEKIPPEVMTVLKDPSIPIAIPAKKDKPACIGTFRRFVKNVIELILPKSVSEKLVPKISPELLNDINTVAIRMNKLVIKDKSEGIFRGNAEIYFISLVNDGVTEPNLLRVETFKNIREGDDLFDKGLQKPFTLYLSEEGKVPRLMDFRLLIMEEDKRGSRKAEEIIDAITKDGDYKKIIEAIRILIKNSAPSAAIFTLVDTAIGVIKRILRVNEDDQLLYYAARFTKDFDNLGVGSYDKNYEKVDLGYEIIAK
jgi:hypothetical protein